jgi:hypothetical protein
MSIWPLRYRQGKDVVEAVHWAGDDAQREEPRWIVDAIAMDRRRIESGGSRTVRLAVPTPTGWALAERGDWKGFTVAVHDARPDRLEKVTLMSVLNEGARSWPPEGDIALWMVEAALRVGVGRRMKDCRN